MARIEREKIMAERMIRLYCRRHGKDGTLCADCRDLLDYALKRLGACRYGDAKPACKKCPTHCYTPLYRNKIREVMRCCAPLMPLYDPLGTIRYLLGK